MSVESTVRAVTTYRLTEMKQRGEKIAMLTSYDYSMAKIVDAAGIDVILVGDSAANVMAGYETTVPITLDMMIYHARSVVRAVERALVVVDLPFGTYQGNSKVALDSAIRIMKETEADAVKMEGGEEILESVQRILSAGIPVMGHLGLTPQSIHKFGTYAVRAKEEAEAEKLLAVQSDYIRRRFDCSDFYLVYYPYILRTFGKRGSGILSEKTENELTDCLLGFRYWIDEPGNDAMWFWSENHALMFHTCQLLAGELFPDEVFTNSGLTGRQMQAKAKNMLYDWFVTFRKEGFTEWNSSPYLPIDTLGFGSLYAFAQDPAMRELGREGMDFAYYLLAVHSQQGIFASSSGRTYIKEQFGNWSNCPSGLSWIGYGYGVPGHAGKGITSYCLSDYEPPKEFAQWFSIPRGKEMICQTTQGNDGYVDLYTYKTADYMMTSANDFHPGEPGHQENPFQLTFNAVAQLWVTHPGERVLFGAARPSYWAGNGTLPKVNQYKAFAGLIYDIAPEHPVDFTHLYLPSMEFDRCEVEGKWAFVQLGSAYAAVYCSNGMRMQDFGSNKDRECIAEGRRCIWLVRAAQADEFAAFEDFKAAMRVAALDADAEGRRYRFVDPVYGELRCQWGETLYVNDAPMQYSGFDNYGKLTMQEK